MKFVKKSLGIILVLLTMLAVLPLTASAASLKITASPKNTYVQKGQTAKVTVTAQGDGLKYQWYIKNAGATKYTKSSVTKAAYSTIMDEKSNGRYLYCIVSDRYGNSIKTTTVVMRQAVTIETQPKTTYANAGETIKVSVKASGDGLKYQWYIKNAGATKYTKSSVTKATYSTTMDDKSDGRYVYCVITDKYGKTAKTNTVALKKNVALSITSQPKTGYAQDGANVKVTVKAAGEGLKYQWYVKNAGASKYSKSSITKSTYSATMSDTVKDRLVYCVITDKYGNKVQSKTVALRMTVTIKEQPGNVFGLAGQTIYVDVSAVGDDLTYTWFSDRLYSGSFLQDDSCNYGPYYYVDMDYDYYHDFEVLCVITDKYGKQVQTDTVSVIKSAVDYSTIAGRWFPTSWYYDDGSVDYDVSWDIYIYSDATVYFDFNNDSENLWKDLEYYWISGYKHYFKVLNTSGNVELCYHQDTGELWMIFSDCDVKLVRYY